jgi:excisionase family DNA binding protein
MPITYTLQKAAEESGLSIRGLLYAIGRGELESVKSGRRRLIPADSLREFLLGRGSNSTAKMKERVEP